MKRTVQRGVRAVALGFVLSLAAWTYGSAAVGPELTVAPQEGKARPGRPYRIVCEVSWEGDPGAYAIAPAEVDQIEWGTVTVREARAFVRDGRNVVSQTVEIVPDKPGDYKTPEIRIAYLQPEATPPAKTAAAGTVPSAPSVPPTLVADPSEMVVRPSRRLAWVFGGLGTFLLLLLPLGWWSARLLRRPQPKPESAAATSYLAAQDALQQARQYRLDGEFYEYYRALGRAARPVAPDLADTLDVRGKAVGYRGVRPTDDDMDSDWRAVERVLSQKQEEVEA